MRKKTKAPIPSLPFDMESYIYIYILNRLVGSKVFTSVT